MKAVGIVLAIALSACGADDKGGNANLASSDNATSADSTIEQQKAVVEQEKSNGWTTEIKNGFHLGCTDNDEYSRGFMNLYCSCMIEKIIPRYTPDYFTSHSTTLLEKLLSDGTVKTCVDKAKDLNGGL
jgi:hypothetical protein